MLELKDQTGMIHYSIVAGSSMHENYDLGSGDQYIEVS